ncbi:MAG: hypothetical protein H0V68_01055, partial [Actinobacteria bacterium]|nr:hypothetical protein [Actinomycetota bacterium]
MFIVICALGAVFTVPSAAAAPISLTGPYGPETFDSLANTGTTNTTGVPAGWEFSETGTNANTSYAAGTGSDNGGNTYSYGTAGSTERAFGQLRSGSLVSTIGASFTNNTGSTITSLDVAYRGEQWRLGTNTAGRLADRMDFQYSTDATSLTTGTWIDVNTLDFSSPTLSGTVGALNGNTATNFTSISNTIVGLSIANGATFYIRWTDIDVSSSDDGLAVDDFSLTPQGGGGVTLSINDATVTEGNAATTTASFTITLSAPAPAGGVTFDIATQDGTAAAGSDYVARSLTGQTIAAGSTTSTFDVTVNGDTTYEPNETFLVNVTNVSGATVADGQGQGTITNDDAPPTVAIHTVQGSTHLSPLSGQTVTVEGIVTAIRSNGFYVQEQDAEVDADTATSEGIFVFTSSAPTVTVGHSVSVTGSVVEFRPGGSGGAANLTTTELTTPTIVVNSTGNALPGGTVVGSGGRVPPTEVIEDDATGDVETSGVFDPASDGIDFYESLEAMFVRVNDPVAVGPRSDFGEIAVLADDGAGQGVRTARGGIVIRPTDFNPERIILDDGLTGVSTPAANVGDHLSSPVTAVVDYGFGNFKFLLTTTPTVVAGSLAPETTAATLGGHVSIATFNVENLDPTDAQSKFDALAAEIVANLKAPDVVALEEIQDNDGPGNTATSTVVAADQTYNKLIAAIDAQTADPGPTYQFRQIDPVDDQDGGEPGGNIRVGFIFRTDRGLAFVDRPGGTSTAANTVLSNGDLAFSPGRIAPTNSAFDNSRKPL